MIKLTPLQKWNNVISTRLIALKFSDDFKILRKSSLNSLGRKRRYSNVDHWRTDFSHRATSSSYQEWLFGKCKVVAERYGLNTQVVSMLCLIKGFNPEKKFKPFALEATTAAVYVVTETADKSVLEKLVYEAYTLLGIPLIQKTGSGEIRHTAIDESGSKDSADIALNKTNSILTLFKIRIELPTGYPPDLAKALTSYAIAVDRQLRERLGYKLPKRLRTSKYIQQAGKYKVTRKTLPKGKAFDIVDDLYGGGDELGKDMESDQKRRTKVNVTRFRLKKELLNSGK